MRRVYHPVEVDAAGQTFEIHTGNPGKPRVYRKTRGGSLRRVPDTDPVLMEVAKAFRDGVDKKKAAEERELKRKSGRMARLFRWVGALLARMWLAILPKR